MRVLRALLPLVAALAACQTPSGDSARAPDAHLQRILERGVLRVAVSADRPPLNLKNGRGEIIGFEADLVRSLADAMDLELQFVVQPFAELIPALLRDEADLALSGLTMTPERNARVAFAGPYYVSGMSVLARDPELTKASSPGALDQPGRKYAAVEASTSAKFVSEQLTNATLVRVPDYTTGVQQVLGGQVDALFADHLVCALEVWRHPEANLSALEPPLTIEPLGIAIPPDAPLLLNLVENHLETLDHTGLLATFRARWLADGRWLSEQQ